MSQQAVPQTSATHNASILGGSAAVTSPKKLASDVMARAMIPNRIIKLIRTTTRYSTFPWP
jgi:hypothetical protein